MDRGKYPKRLIEVDLPIKRISAHARREKSIRHGHISTLHIWWARRPLAACRSVICASLWPDPEDLTNWLKIAELEGAEGPMGPEIRAPRGCTPTEGVMIRPRRFLDEACRQMRRWAERNANHKGVSEESFSRLVAIQKNAAMLDDPIELRRVLLDFIADFANWDNSTEPAFLDTARALTQAAHEALGGEPGTRPMVVDPFAGGGSIPLEALRVGADAFASDLNPIPVLLNKVVLEYIPKHGQKLADEVRKWGRWIKEQAEKELGEFYPKDPDGSTPIAYLWARTILSEAPGQGDIPVEVPLMRSLWLAKKAGRRRALRWVRDEKGRVKTQTVEVTYCRGTGFQPVIQPASQSAPRQDHGLEAHATYELVPFDAREVSIRYSAYLPHWEQESATYAVTFRLDDSLPRAVLDAWLRERQEVTRRAEAAGRPLTDAELRRLRDLHSEQVEKYLDAGHGACHLKDARAAAIMRDALRHFDGQRYDLIAWCVMPNHVHVVVRPRPGEELAKITHSWKSFTSNGINKALGRKGTLWQPDSFDHLIRDADDLERSVQYVLDNPRAAGLSNWPWSGCGTGGGTCFQPVKQDPNHGQDAHATTNHGLEGRATIKVKRPLLEIFEPKKDSEVEGGTVARGSATCPVTGFTTKVDSVRAQLKKRRGGAADARLFCIVTTRADAQGRFYRLPTKADQAAFDAAAAELERRERADGTERSGAARSAGHRSAAAHGDSGADGRSLVPDEVISLNELRRVSVPIYGMERWGDLFSPRQALALTTLARLVREASVRCARAVINPAATSAATSGSWMATGRAGACPDHPGMATRRAEKATAELAMSPRRPGTATADPGRSAEHPQKATGRPGMATDGPEKATDHPENAPDGPKTRAARSNTAFSGPPRGYSSQSGLVHPAAGGWAEALATCLACVVDREAEHNNSLGRWNSSGEKL